MARKTERARITKRTTYEVFVAEARRLSGLAEAAEIEFLSYLYDAEQVPEIWQGTGYSFMQMLRHTNLCAPARYRSYKTVRAQQGEQAIADVGIHAVIQAGRFPDADQQRAVIAKAKSWEKSNGSAIPPESARKISDEVRTQSMPRTAGHPRRSTSQRDMSSENERLRSENEMLRLENETLRSENEKLHAELRRLRSRQPSARRTAHVEA